MIKDDADALPQAGTWAADVRAQALARMARPPARVPRTLRIAALAVLLALHTALFLFWYANRFSAPAKDTSVVQVRLIDESAAPLPSLPEPAQKAASRSAQRPISSQPVAAELKTEPSPPPLFNRDGTVRLPPQPAPTPLETGLARGRELLARGHNIIHCRRSRFDNSPTPAEAAASAARGAHMVHMVMGNPLDPLNDVGQQQAEDATGEHAAEKRKIEEQACDY